MDCEAVTSAWTSRSTSGLSDYDYHYLNFTAVNETRLGRLLLRTRFFAQAGVGDKQAPESALYFAGANPEAMMDNKYTRSVGFFPQDWGGFGEQTNHFHPGGGLNLRGYSGYHLVEENPDGETQVAYREQSGAAINAELDLDELVRFRPKGLRNYFHLDIYLFGDAGLTAYEYGETDQEDLALSEIRFDAGLGSALTIKRFGPFDMIRPLTIRFDMPFFLSHVPAASLDNPAQDAEAIGDHLKFRFVVGVERAF